MTTTYTVVPGAAGENGTLPTLAAAAAVVAPGDVVDIAPGTYRERLICDVARVTWRSVAPGAAVLHGGWNGATIGNSPAQIAVSAAGVVLDGLAVRNTPGDGIGIGRGAHGTKVLRCATDTTYSGGIICNAGERLDDVLISECVVLRAGLSWPAGRRPLVSGSMNLVRCYNAIVEKTVVAYGYGEGINIDKASVGVIVRGCVIFDNAHLCMYFNRSRDCKAEGNLLYLTGLEARSSGNWPAGIVIGDECGGNADTFPFGGGNVIRGNVVVNCGTLFHVRNNAKADGYNTQLDAATVIEHNTFVAGPLTRAGIHINENTKGRPHGAARVRGNAVHFSHAAPGADMAASSGAAIRWTRNAWTQAPPASVRGAGDVVGFQLVNPGYIIPLGWPAGDVTANVEHYRPPPLSPLVGAGPDGSTIGALAAASEPPPPPPPPPPAVDWPALIADVQAAAQEIADLAAHGSAIRDDIARMMSNIAAGNDELAEVERHAGEARLRLDALMEKLGEYGAG